MAGTDSAKENTLARLATSRAEIRRILEPPPRNNATLPDAGGRDAFPRSRTMKLLLSGRGVGTASAVVGGLLLARPALALRVLRLLPLGALGRMILVKGIAALRARRA